MALESATYINGLVATNPEAGDNVSTADDHLRLLKSTILATFPNVAGEVTATHTELNFLDGVTSALQDQLDAKAALASPAFTGTPTAPTAAASTNTTQVATCAFVQTATGGLSAAGPWTRLGAAATPVNAATVDFKNGTDSVVIDSTYDEYLIVLVNMLPNADNQALWLRTDTNTGASYDAGASDYSWGYVTMDGTNVTSAVDTADAQIVLAPAVGNSTGERGVSGSIYLFAPAASSQLHVQSDLVYRNSSGVLQRALGFGRRESIVAVDAFRLMFASNNMTGTAYLYARRK